MPLRDHGYYGYAFVGARPCQIIALAALVGLAGHFVAQDIHAHLAVPGAVTGTIVTASTALLWTLISVTAYDDEHIPYAVTAVLDILFLVPLIVVGVVLGRPLAGFSCSVLPKASVENANDLLAIALSPSASSSSYILFVGDNQTTCYEIMAAWGLILALCVLFALTGLVTGLLFLGKRRSAQSQKSTLPISNITAPIALPPSLVAHHHYRHAEQIEMSQQQTATKKWNPDDDYDDYEDDDDNCNKYEDHSSVHGSLHSLNSRHSGYYGTECNSIFPPAAPAFPSAHGRSLHPRQSAAVSLGGSHMNPLDSPYSSQ